MPGDGALTKPDDETSKDDESESKGRMGKKFDWLKLMRKVPKVEELTMARP